MIQVQSDILENSCVRVDAVVGQPFCDMAFHAFHVHAIAAIFSDGFRSECKSGRRVRVGYSDPARAIGVAMRRAWARAWVVWGDTTERQPHTCEWDRAVMRYLAFNGRRSGTRLAPAVMTPHRRTNTDRVRFFPFRDPRHIARLN